MLTHADRMCGWCEIVERKVHALNFKSRVALKSVKNFQIASLSDSKISSLISCHIQHWLKPKIINILGLFSLFIVFAETAEVGGIGCQHLDWRTLMQLLALCVLPSKHSNTKTIGLITYERQTRSYRGLEELIKRNNKLISFSCFWFIPIKVSGP